MDPLERGVKPLASTKREKGGPIRFRIPHDPPGRTDHQFTHTLCVTLTPIHVHR